MTKNDVAEWALAQRQKDHSDIVFVGKNLTALDLANGIINLIMEHGADLAKLEDKVWYLEEDLRDAEDRVYELLDELDVCRD